MKSPSRILICDDDEAFVQSSTISLLHEEFECETVDTARSALECIKQRFYDLCICDLDLAGTPHLDLIRTIATLNQKIQFVLVAESPCVDTALNCMELPVIGYFEKPVLADAFLMKIRSGIKCAQSASQLDGVLAHMERLAYQLEDLERIYGQNDLTASVEAEFSALKRHTVGQIVRGLRDIQRLIPTTTDAGNRQGHAIRNKAQRLHYVDAILETIMVLEKTKSAFKSRDLARLRKKLEVLAKGEGM